MSIAPVYWLGLCVETNSIRISTLPPKGPYRVGQIIQLFCEVGKEENVTITWNIFASIFGGGSYATFGNSFNWTFNQYDYILHYCLFYCRVAVNGTFIAKAKRVIEVQGKQ